MKTVDTYWANIYVGTRGGYSDYYSDIAFIEDMCQKYCNDLGLCVTSTPTKFIYVKGEERGAIVGLINYPRFPATNDEIREKALDLAELLMVEMDQNRVSVVFPDETVMLGKDED